MTSSDTYNSLQYQPSYHKRIIPFAYDNTLIDFGAWITQRQLFKCTLEKWALVEKVLIRRSLVDGNELPLYQELTCVFFKEYFSSPANPLLFPAVRSFKIIEPLQAYHTFRHHMSSETIGANYADFEQQGQLFFTLAEVGTVSGVSPVMDIAIDSDALLVDMAAGKYEMFLLINERQ